MKRGEIWTVSGAPGYGSKPRPALIVQSDALMGTASILTCGFTSVLNTGMAFRPLVEPSTRNQLEMPSSVMVERLTAVSREKLGKRLGLLTPTEMLQVDQALLVVLGLAE